MRRTVFAIFAFVMLVCDAGLRPLLHFDAGLGWVCPSGLLILGAFVAMWAPPMTVLWSMLVLGLCTDLLPLQVGSGAGVTPILGPSSLGYLVGGYAAIQMRNLLYRDSTLAVAAMVFVAGVFLHLTAVALLTFRGIPLPMLDNPVAHWNAAEQLFHRLLEVIYTAVLAIPLGFVLQRCRPILGFDSGKGPGFWRRSSR